MNLLLFEAAELRADQSLVLKDRRHRHLLQVLKARHGDRLRVGQIDGERGSAEITAIDNRQAVLQVNLREAPPPPLQLTLVLALPRPKMLRRILRSIAEVGIKELYLINSFRVEKSYWQSPLLQPASLRDYLLAGLEQAGDTRLPALHMERRFRPFAEDLLPGLVRGRHGLLAEPAAGEPYPSTPRTPSLLAIGPEGGFIPWEVEQLVDAGCQPRNLGSRTLRVETALHCAIGRHLGADRI